MRTVAAPIITVIAALVASASPGSQSEERFHDLTYGFSVAVPNFPKETDAGVAVTPVVFGGPLRDGKAPSCNVQIQNVGTLSNFRTQSLGQLNALGLSLESESRRQVSKKDALLLVSSGHDLKVFSLAVQVDQSIDLVTCVAPLNQFTAYEKTFRRVIDSFSVD